MLHHIEAELRAGIGRPACLLVAVSQHEPVHREVVGDCDDALGENGVCACITIPLWYPLAGVKHPKRKYDFLH
jgi:hypothetical protein